MKFYFNIDSVDLKGYQESTAENYKILSLKNLKKVSKNTKIELKIYLYTTLDIDNDVKVKIDIFYNEQGDNYEGLRIEKRDET